MGSSSLPALLHFLSIVILTIHAAALRSAEPPTKADLESFIATHCLDCHSGADAEASLDLSASSLLPLNDGNLQTWIKVHDRVNAGEMPPDGVLSPEKSQHFTDVLYDKISTTERKQIDRGGRAVWRRMNREEYENSVRDLLDAPWLQLRGILPEDGRVQRFNKLGEALDVSHVHMARYLQAADYALRQVVAGQIERPPVPVQRFYARDQNSFARKSRFSQFNRSAERATFPLIDYQPDLPVLLDPDQPYSVGESDPQTREREAFGVVASTYEPLEIRFDKFEAPEPGRYRLRFKGYTFWAGPSEGEKWYRANREETSIGRRSEPVVVYSEVPPRQLRRLGQFDFEIAPSVQELEVWLLKGETIRPDAVRLFRSRPSNWRNPLAEKDGMPGVAFSYLEVEGPIYDTWPPRGHQLLFGDLPISLKNLADPSFQPEHPLQDAQRLLSEFVSQAYRRPVDEAETTRFLDVVNRAIETGSSFGEAMLSGYTAVLCSPAFLCTEESPGRLDDFALASRLSFFLWNSSPDNELRQLAQQGSLSDPTVLRQQVERLLANPNSRRFVNAFLDDWLDLRRINETSADEFLYPDYYLDDALVDAALEETQLFFCELIRENLAVSNLIDSDFTFINERLATHYGLPAVEGTHLRRVDLPDDSPRGGLLTQASVLKVTANGTVTSPVVRGAWVCERILGQKPPPPPPSVPAIEADTRGATTIRQQLELHRSDESCNVCHQKIDPPGFALENFDVLGGWQEHYRSLGENGVPATGIGKNGQPFNFRWSAKVDASGTTATGETFSNIIEFKRLLQKDTRQLARNLTRQLLVYATAAPMRFSDRRETEQLLDVVAEEGFGVKSIIEAVATSPMFLSK